MGTTTQVLDDGTALRIPIPDEVTAVGTSAAKDIPASGDASVTQVVYGTDTRLTNARTPAAHVHVAGDVTGTAVLTADSRLSDARTPTAHASTHLSNGSDPVGAASTTVRGTVTTTSATSQVASTDDARLSDARTPTAHKASHENNGSDEISVLGLSGLLADAQTPLSHTHVAGDVTGTAVLTADSRLSDARTPLAHAASHKSGGSDAIKLDELAAPTDVTTLNATTALHGLLPKLGGGSANFLRADGTWAAPTAGAATTNPSLYITAADYDLAASYSICFPAEYEVGSGFVTDLAATAILEIA